MHEVQDGSDWVIDGGKCWISNSLEAGVFVVFANADPSKGHRGPDKNDKTMFKGVEVHNGWAVVSESDFLAEQFRLQASQRLWWTRITKVYRSARRLTRVIRKTSCSCNFDLFSFNFHVSFT